MYNFNVLRTKLKQSEEHLIHEYQSLRTGRATPAVLDTVNVDIYGSQSKISHIAAISVEDAKTLRLSPYDKTAVKHIESAIAAANLGLSVVADGSGLRVIFPEMTAERRKVLEKLLKEKHEETRVTVKRAREDTWNDIGKEEKDGRLSEDDKFRLKDELQRLIDDCNKRLEEITARKLQEISG